VTKQRTWHISIETKDHRDDDRMRRRWLPTNKSCSPDTVGVWLNLSAARHSSVIVYEY
jgi:hypothetical protein